MNSEAEAVNYLKVGGLEVAEGLYDFIKDEAAPGTGVRAEDFWRALAGIVEALGPRNRALLQARAALQQKIDAWHIERRQRGHDAVAYKAFLQDIGYLVEPPEDIQSQLAASWHCLGRGSAGGHAAHGRDRGSAKPR